MAFTCSPALKPGELMYSPFGAMAETFGKFGILTTSFTPGVPGLGSSRLKIRWASARCPDHSETCDGLHFAKRCPHKSLCRSPHRFTNLGLTQGIRVLGVNIVAEGAKSLEGTRGSEAAPAVWMIALRKHIGNLGQVTDQIHGCIKRAGHPFDQIFVNGFSSRAGSGSASVFPLEFTIVRCSFFT